MDPFHQQHHHHHHHQQQQQQQQQQRRPQSSTKVQQFVNQMEASKNKLGCSNMQQQNNLNNSNKNRVGGILHQINHPPSPNSQAGCVGGISINKGLNKLVPQCNGSYGQNNNADVAATAPTPTMGNVKTMTMAASAMVRGGNGAVSMSNASKVTAALPTTATTATTNTATTTVLPPVEDVIRWKEFRRRQKMETFYENYQQRQSLGDKLTRGEYDLNAAVMLGVVPGATGDDNTPHMDSLSLSLSESTMGTNHDPTKQHHHQHQHQQTSLGAMVPSNNSASPGGSGITEIDEEGFPLLNSNDSFISPTSLGSEELRMGRSMEEEDPEEHEANYASVVLSAQSQAADAEKMEGDERNKYFTTLDCSSIDNAIKNERKDCTEKSERRSNDEDAATITSASPSEAPPSSEVPTEITSNTARYVANQSNLMARRMMSMPEQGLRVSTSQDGDMAMTDCAANDDGSSNNGPLASESAAKGRTKLAATPAGECTPMSSVAYTPNFQTPGWDPTKTTVENDQLESVLATPKELNVGREGDNVRGMLLANASMEPFLGQSYEGGKEEDKESNAESNVESNVSMVSSNWDPLHVSTIEEEENDDDAPSIKYDTAEVEISPANSRDSSRYSSKDDASKDDDIPTLAEVNVFMSQLKKLKKDNPNKKKSPPSSKKMSSSFSSTYTSQPPTSPPIEGMVHLPAASTDEVVLREESLEFNRSLLEKKEKLRKHKLESDRKKKDFDERLKAMRTKVNHSASPGGSSMGDDSESCQISMLPLSTPRGAVGIASARTPTSMALEQQEDCSFPTDEKAASSSRWSGGVARWNASSSPARNLDDDDMVPQKLNVAVDEDDFSFKPPSVVGGGGNGNNILISPQVAAAAAGGGNAKSMDSAKPKNRFNFSLSPSSEQNASFDQTQQVNTPSSSPMATFLTSIGNAATSKLRSRSEPPPLNSGRSIVVPVAVIADDMSNISRNPLYGKELSIADSESSFSRAMGDPFIPNNAVLESTHVGEEPSPRNFPTENTSNAHRRLPPSSPPRDATVTSSTSGSNLPSPDTSEGDKCGGTGFGYTFPNSYMPSTYIHNMRTPFAGDKSIISKTSSNFVELGLSTAMSQEDPPCEDLLGVTIKGSKKRSKKIGSRIRASIASPFEPVKEVASRCSGTSSIQEGESQDVADADPSTYQCANNSNDTNRKPLDPDGFDWKELNVSKQKEEEHLLAQLKQQQFQHQEELQQQREPQQQQKELQHQKEPQQQEGPQQKAEKQQQRHKKLKQQQLQDQSPPSPQEKKVTLPQENIVPKKTSSIDNDEEFVSARSSSSDDVGNRDFVAVMDRAKSCLAPRDAKTVCAMDSAGSVHTTGTVNIGAVYQMTPVSISIQSSRTEPSQTEPSQAISSRFGNKNSLSINEMPSKFETSAAIDASETKIFELVTSENGSVISAASSQKGPPKRKNAPFSEAPSFESASVAFVKKDSPKRNSDASLATPSFELDSCASAQLKDYTKIGESMEARTRIKSKTPKRSARKSTSFLKMPSLESASDASARKDSQQRKNAASLTVPSFESDSGASAIQKGTTKSGASVEAKSRTESLTPQRNASVEVKSRFEAGNITPMGTRDFSISRFKKPAVRRGMQRRQGESDGGAAGWKNYTAGLSLIRSTSREEFQKEVGALQHNNSIASNMPEIRDTPSEENNGIGITSSKSSDSVSIKKLRSRFESSKQEQLTSKQQQLATPNGQQRKQQNKAHPKSSAQQGSPFREPPTLTKGSFINGPSSMIGSGIYLKNTNIQAMSSLGNETLDSAESSLNKSESNEDNTVGSVNPEDGTLNTKKVLRYAKILERRNVAGSHETEDLEVNGSEPTQSFDNSIEKKDTTTSSLKENCNAGDVGKKGLPVSNNLSSTTKVAADGNNGDDPPNICKKNISQVKSRRKAFQVRKNPPVAQTYQQYVKTPEKLQKVNDSSLSPKKEDDVLPTAPNVGDDADDTQIERSPATSVRDRIAVFGHQKATPVKNKTSSVKKSSTRNSATPPRTHTCPTKMGGPPQQQHQQKLTGVTPPPSIAINHTTETPSPLWVVPNRNNGQGGFSPIIPNKQHQPIYGNNIHPNLTPHVNSNLSDNHRPPSNNNIPPPVSVSPPITNMLRGNQRGGEINCPAPIHTRYESPSSSHYEDDGDDDGITLSPTFSEVSGLTMPTCIATVNGDASVSAQSDIFDNLPSLTNTNPTPNFDALSPIARHRQRNEKEKSALSAGAKLAKHPYLQRMHSKQGRTGHVTEEAAPTNNKNVDSAVEHEIKTPRARGRVDLRGQSLSRRDQIVSRVRASPRHKQFPQHSTNNVASNHPVTLNPTISQSASGASGTAMGSHFRTFDGRTNSGLNSRAASGYLPPAQKPKGKVAEGVETQEWQKRNTQVEKINKNHLILLSTSGVSGNSNGSPFRNHHGRIINGPRGGGVDGFLPPAQKPKGKVAESVDRANRKAKMGNRQGGVASWWSRNEGNNSSANQDCIRID